MPCATFLTPTHWWHSAFSLVNIRMLPFPSSLHVHKLPANSCLYTVPTVLYCLLAILPLLIGSRIICTQVPLPSLPSTPLPYTPRHQPTCPSTPLISQSREVPFVSAKPSRVIVFNPQQQLQPALVSLHCPVKRGKSDENATHLGVPVPTCGVSPEEGVLSMVK